MLGTVGVYWIGYFSTDWLTV